MIYWRVKSSSSLSKNSMMRFYTPSASEHLPSSIYLQPVYHYLWRYCKCQSFPFALCFYTISCYRTPLWDLPSLFRQSVKTGAWHCFSSVTITTICFLFSSSLCRCSLHHLHLSCHKGFRAASPDGFQWLYINMWECWELYNLDQNYGLKKRSSFHISVIWKLHAA